MNLKIINHIDFEKLIKIKFNNILDGFEEYNYIEICSSKKDRNESELDFIRCIETFFDLNQGSLIIDFYKNNLTSESIRFIKSNLDNEDIKSFDELLELVNSKNIYYKLENKKYISILTKLCTRELFFITFYFYKFPGTLWGNYNMKFPLFYNDSDSFSEYINIVKMNNLL
jgi:hypothetical protein